MAFRLVRGALSLFPLLSGEKVMVGQGATEEHTHRTGGLFSPSSSSFGCLESLQRPSYAEHGEYFTTNPPVLTGNPELLSLIEEFDQRHMTKPT